MEPRPSKIVAIGRNYSDHVAELGDRQAPQRPRIFFKPPSSLVSSGQHIVIPRESQRVEHEAELAVVIGRRMRRVSAADALGYVSGYAAANDVTARDLQKLENLPDFAKSFDTFCPLGQVAAADGVDPADLLIECRVNGDLRQSGRTSAMLTPLPELLAHIAAAMTLEPGDVVLTGTPAGVGPLVAGDSVEVRISGLPVLVSPVRSE